MSLKNITIVGVRPSDLHLYFPLPTLPQNLLPHLRYFTSLNPRTDSTFTSKASGNLGKGILPHLLAASSLNITLLARSTSSAQFPAGAKVIRSEFSLASLTEVLKGQDAVISLMPIPAAGEQVTVIEAAIAAGVKRFIPSEFGSDNSVRMTRLKMRFPRGKRKNNFIQMTKYCTILMRDSYRRTLLSLRLCRSLRQSKSPWSF